MSRQLEQTVRRLLAPIVQRVVLMVGKAQVLRVDDEDALQLLQLEALEDEVHDRVEHWQPYGFVSRPLKGARALIAAVAGNRDHLAAVAVADPRHRPAGELEEGEAGLYTDEALLVRLLRGRILRLGAAADGPHVAVARAPDVEGELARVKADLDQLKAAIQAAPVAPMDGGATFKAALVTSLSAWPSNPGSVGSPTVETT